MIYRPIQYIGKLIKTIGYKGELSLKLEVPFNENMLQQKILYLELEGLPVPFFISPEGLYEKDENTLIVKFDDINDESEAKKLISTKVFIEKYIENSDLDASNINSLKSYTVKDVNYGEIGWFEKIIDIPGNPLIQIIKNSTEILLPLTDETIQEINDNKKEILVKTPEGLIDVYLEK